MKTKPSISAFCTTYGRPARFLNEVIECFLLQDYEGESELVILNDWRQQRLIYDGDERVKIFNLSERILPLGKVFNETIARCSGDIIMPWESDDIFLPHRMSTTVEKMKKGFFHSSNAWFYNQGDSKLDPMGNWCLCNIAAHKDLWKEVGYFDERGVSSIDTTLITSLKEASGQKSQDLTQKEAFYMYRWNTGSYHASGWGGDNPHMARDVANSVHTACMERKVETGDVQLSPQWYRDYTGIVSEWLENNKGATDEDSA